MGINRQSHIRSSLSTPASSTQSNKGAHGQAKFAYLIRMFPQTSETFIANEILRVERTGAPIRIYSYRRPVENVEHEVVRLIQSPIDYLPDPLWKSIANLLGRARAVT